MIHRLAIFGLVWGIFSAPALANEITLRSSIIVDDRYVRLGDFFNVTGENAFVKIAHAPRPGKRTVYDAKWLYRVARAYKLSWRPLSHKTRATVERASQEVYREEIEDVLMSVLRDKGVKGSIELSFNGRATHIYVAANQSTTVGIDGMTYDARSRRFVATLVAPLGDPAAQRVRISGSVHNLVSIPVVTRRLRRGDVIREDDIAWLNQRESKSKRDVIMDETLLIGKASKRSIAPNTAIKSSYVRRPLLIAKGGLVTIQLKTGLMRLTTQGQALEEGSLGDTVRIKNKQSKRIIEGKVIGAGEVQVLAMRRSALN